MTLRTPVSGLAVMLVLVLACTPSGNGSEADGASEFANPVIAELNAALPPVGSLLPALSGITLDGESIGNAALSGRTVLINLWFFH